MPRPVKPRRIAALPSIRKFKPIDGNGLEVKLKFDEFEAIRLKDVEGLSQEEAAKKMRVSRQTYQLILESGHKKVGIALTEGRSIIIDGGNVTVNICKYTCATCGHEFESAEQRDVCPKCGKREAVCEPTEDYCATCCKKRRGRKNCPKHRAK